MEGGAQLSTGRSVHVCVCEYVCTLVVLTDDVLSGRDGDKLIVFEDGRIEHLPPPPRGTSARRV